MGASEFVAVRGARLWTVTQGTGPPLVLCHGGPGLWDNLEDVAGMVDDRVTVHRYDQRGCGRSDDAGPYTVEQAVADLESLREHWGHERWVVAGHSWGASLALAYALRHADSTLGLLYVSGHGGLEPWRSEYRAERDRRLSPGERARLTELRGELAGGEGTSRFARLSDELCRILWATDFADRASGEMLVERLLQPRWRPNYAVNAALNADWQRLQAEAGPGGVAGQIAGFERPALVVHGDADLRPLGQASALASRLPRGRLAVSRGAGHYPWIEQPEQFRREVRGFIEGLADLPAP